MRRLMADHACLHRQELPPYYLHVPGADDVPDDPFQLQILLAGPPGTPYADGVWRLQLSMPITYPKEPPKAAFRTKIFHPNVEERTGAVCLDTLKRDWQPSLTLRDILMVSNLGPAIPGWLGANGNPFFRRPSPVSSSARTQTLP